MRSGTPAPGGRLGPPERLRVIVADRDSRSRRALKALLDATEHVDVLAETSDGTDAVSAIDEIEPDVVFLDVSSPRAAGFDVVTRMACRDRGLLVALVGNAPSQAVKAFELNVLDYLLKPVTASRLRVTLERAHQRLDTTHRETEASEVTEIVERHSHLVDDDAVLQRIPVRKNDCVTIVPARDVVSIVAHGECLHLLTSTGGQHIITYRLKELEKRLDARRFVRLSRGTLVNVDYLHRFEPLPSGLLKATLTTGHKYEVSRLRGRALRDTMLRL